MLPSPSFGNYPTAIDHLRASPNPDHATAQTIRRMAQIIQSSLSSPIVRAAAHQATRHLPATAGPRQRAEAIWWWVKTHVVFVQDEAILRSRLGIFTPEELLIAPSRLLTMDTPSGDCDDFTMLVCSMLLVSGIACEPVTIADAWSPEPGEWTHVYPVAFFSDGTAMAMDASHGEFPGWEVPAARISRYQRWPLFASTGLHGFRGPHRGLGQADDTVDLSSLFSSFTDDTSAINAYIGADPIDPATSSTVSSSLNWNNIIPNLFSSIEKIAIQQTVPAGQYQQTTAAGTVVYQTPTSGPAAGIMPSILGTNLGINTASLSSLLPLLGIGLVALLVFGAMEHK